MPPTPVSGAPRVSHDAADTPGIKSDHRSRSIRTSYTDVGVAVDDRSTVHDTEADITRKLLQTAALQRGYAIDEPPRGCVRWFEPAGYCASPSIQRLNIFRVDI